MNMATERTFLMVKPDGVRRNLIGCVLGPLCDAKFVIIGLRLTTLFWAPSKLGWFL